MQEAMVRVTAQTAEQPTYMEYITQGLSLQRDLRVQVPTISYCL
jgi:hypothetical protein